MQKIDEIYELLLEHTKNNKLEWHYNYNDSWKTYSININPSELTEDKVCDQNYGIITIQSYFDKRSRLFINGSSFEIEDNKLIDFIEKQYKSRQEEAELKLINKLTDYLKTL